VFGLILLATSVKIFRDAGHEPTVDVDRLRSVRLVRRIFPSATPTAVATVALLGTDVVFAIDSVPAVYGITEDPYLVFATNAFALLGLRALYFLLAGLLARLAHLSYGLGAILVVIGVKLILHWGHELNPGVPQIPTLVSLALVIGILLTVTATSLISGNRERSLLNR
jgi:predicted tellurium resistance membrane protein TerC